MSDATAEAGAVGDVGVLFALRDEPALVARAEQLGYESAWAAEGQGKSAFGKLERWAVHTERIGLATGIVNVFSRTPAAIAQAAATLDAHSGGRAILGLGVAHPGVVEGFHGAEFERPLPRMDEYIELVRRYLRGDPEGFDGEFFSPSRTAFWEAFEPERASIPIYNGALGPANVRLTGQFADGWVPNLYPDSQFKEAQGWLADGAARADRDPAAAQAGYEDVVEAVRSASSLAAGADAVADGLLDHLAVVGTPEEARAQLDHLRELGVDLPIVRAPAGSDREWVERTLEAFAPSR